MDASSRVDLRLVGHVGGRACQHRLQRDNALLFPTLAELVSLGGLSSSRAQEWRQDDQRASRWLQSQHAQKLQQWQVPLLPDPVRVSRVAGSHPEATLQPLHVPRHRAGQKELWLTRMELLVRFHKRRPGNQHTTNARLHKHLATQAGLDNSAELGRGVQLRRPHHRRARQSSPSGPPRRVLLDPSLSHLPGLALTSADGLTRRPVGPYPVSATRGEARDLWTAPQREHQQGPLEDAQHLRRPQQDRHCRGSRCQKLPSGEPRLLSGLPSSESCRELRVQSVCYMQRNLEEDASGAFLSRFGERSVPDRP